MPSLVHGAFRGPELGSVQACDIDAISAAKLVSSWSVQASAWQVEIPGVASAFYIRIFGCVRTCHVSV